MSCLTLLAGRPYSFRSFAPFRGERRVSTCVIRRPGLPDNRKFSRVPSRLRCWCEGNNVTVYARIGNLSEGGLFLRTSTPLERGSRAVLRFGSDQAVEAHARVVWARVEGQGGPPGMGLEFETVDEGAKQAIRQIIEIEKTQKQASN